MATLFRPPTPDFNIPRGLLFLASPIYSRIFGLVSSLKPIFSPAAGSPTQILTSRTNPHNFSTLTFSTPALFRLISAPPYLECMTAAGCQCGCNCEYLVSRLWVFHLGSFMHSHFRHWRSIATPTSYTPTVEADTREYPNFFNLTLTIQVLFPNFLERESRNCRPYVFDSSDFSSTIS